MADWFHTKYKNQSVGNKEYSQQMVLEQLVMSPEKKKMHLNL